MNIDKEKFDLDWLIKQISPRGNGKTLKTNKPKDGIAAYVWRMARFHSGIDVTMPMTVTFTLADQIEKDNPNIKFKCGIFGAFEKSVLDELDDLVDKCLDKLGLNKYGATSAYKGLLY